MKSKRRAGMSYQEVGDLNNKYEFPECNVSHLRLGVIGWIRLVMKLMTSLHLVKNWFSIQRIDTKHSFLALLRGFVKLFWKKIPYSNGFSVFLSFN